MQGVREESRSAFEEAWRRWMQQRVDEVHRRVSVFDVLLRNGVKLRQSGHEQQISCPFHGADKKPSARVFPAESGSPSHVWCFVCQERWDCISLWRKFEGREGIKFGAALRTIEDAYGIKPPEKPPALPSLFVEPDEDDLDRLRVQALLEACEGRLRQNKKAFDMLSFLRIGVVLDRLRHQVEGAHMADESAVEVLQQVLDKISARVRMCPDD